MKKNKSKVNPVSFKPKPIALAVQHALPYLVALGLGAAVISPAVGRSGDSAAAFTATQLIRQFTLKNTVAQVSQGMQGYVAEFNGVLRASEMGAVVGGYPVDMGSVPSSVNLPQRDGSGRPLGYCAWDNSASTSNSSFLAGQGVTNPLVYAVVSPGLNGSMETSCAYILANRRGLGDDYVQVTAPSQTSSKQFKSAVGTYAELTAMQGEEGDIRLVLETNKLYSYVGSTWQPVDASKFNDDSAANGAGAIAYTAGKVTVADFQAASATITGALSGSAATFTSSVTANSFIGNGAALTDLNANNVNSGVLGAAFGGTGVDSSAASQGSLLIGTGAGFALGTISAGDGIGVLNGAGSITISNTGVLSIAGTNNQIIASAANGDVVLSLPQDIATTSVPTFAGAIFNGNIDLASISQAGVPATLAFQYASDTGSTFYAEPNLGLGTGALAGRKSAGNVAIGMNVLGRMSTLGYGSESGSWNTGVGYQALFSNDYGDENTAVGYKSLYSNTTGFYNTAMGSQSMFSNSTGRSNTAIGYDAMRMNTTGSSNTSLGVSALHENTTGYRNVAVGVAALYDNTTGYENVAVGRSALYSNNTGWGNVAIGLQSMQLTSAGTENTAIGHNALRPLISGTENTVLGAWALDAFSSGSGNVAIGANTGNKGTGSDYLLTSGSNNTFVGNASGPALGVSSLDYATAIGAEAEVSTSNTLALGRVTDSIVIGATGIASSGVLLGKKLQVTGDLGATGGLAVGGALGVAGEVVLNTGSLAGFTSVRDLRVYSSDDFSTWNHLRIKADDLGTTIDAGGAENGMRFRIGASASGDVGGQPYNTVLTLLPDQSAIFTGRVDAQSLYISGQPVEPLTKANIETALFGTYAGGNVRLGQGALASNTTGTSNTATGFIALYSNVNGSHNTASGAEALYSNVSGEYNVSVGRSSMVRNTSGSHNTAVGVNTLINNTDGIYNAGLGRDALGNNISGAFNTGAGVQALQSNLGGSYNSGLGYLANVSSGSLSHATVIGANALIATSNTIVLGRTTDTTVIGATGTAASGILQNKILQVTGDVGISGALTIGGTFTATGFSGNGSGLTDLNASNINSGTLDAAYGGTGVVGSSAANGTLLIGNGAGYTLSTLTAGPGIGIANGVGNITIANTGVTTFNGRTGAIVLTRADISSAASSGSANVAVGENSLGSLTTGVYNTAFGTWALKSVSTGVSNTAVGTGSQEFATGSSNTSLGRETLRGASGSNNTAVGHVALGSLTTGDSNSAVGIAAGSGLTTGSNNTLLGTGANVASGALNYATALGSDAIVGTPNTIVLGRATDVTVIGAAVDDGSGNKLQVTGGIKSTGTITGSTGAFTSLNVSGSVDASGTVASTTTVRDLRVMSSFDDAVWDHIRIHNQDGVNAFFDAGGAESGLFFRVSNAGVGGPGTHSYNTVLALHSSRLAEFFGNVNVGGTVAASRLLFTNTASNIAIGGNTLSDLESGYDNIAIGNYVMSGNISGSNNIAIGAGAQNCNETGIRNVAVGYETLNCLVSGDLNTAVGSSALYSTDGFGNTGIGAVALVSNSTGNENTGLGYNAGRQRGNNFAANQRYGSNNTFLGAYSHPVTDTLFYATAIGSDAGVSTNNTVVLGRVADVTVIGSTGDDGSGNKLQVTGGALITGVASLKGGASIATGTNFRFGVAGENSDDIYFLRSDPAANQSSLMLNLGDDPGTFGDVAADEFQISTSGIARFRVAGSGDVIANGYVQATAFNVSSDRRLKTNIQAQDSGAVLSRLEQLQTYSYKYLANPNLGRRIGVIAQEIQSLFPEAVATRADGMMSVDYSALGAMAAMGVGHLSKQVKVLDKTLAEQGERITVLDDRINQHDTRITSLESWRADTSKRMDGMQTAIDLNIQKIAENAVAIQTNSVAIERLDDALFTLDGQVKNNSDLINNINSRWAKNFSESADGSLLTVNAVELKVSNFTAQQLRANSVYSQRLEAEMARIADLEVNNLKANSAVANTVQAEQVNTGSAQVYAGVGLPAVLFAAKSDGHYTVSTSALDGSYATATVIVNAGQAKVVSVASEGIELYAEGNQVKVIAAGKSIKASWIKMG